MGTNGGCKRDCNYVDSQAYGNVDYAWIVSNNWKNCCEWRDFDTDYNEVKRFLRTHLLLRPMTIC